MIIKNKKSIPDQVSEALLDAITSGEIKAGEKLPSEHELCEMFGVSRPSVKTAIDRLNLLGFVEQKVGDGTYIKETSASDFMALYARYYINEDDTGLLVPVLTAIETECLYRLTVHHKREEPDRLAEQIRQIKHHYVNQDTEKAIAACLQFHALICSLSANRYMIQLFRILQSVLEQELGSNYELLSKHIDKYELLLISVQNRQPEAACGLLREMLAFGPGI